MTAVVLALLGVWLPLQPLAAQDLALLRGVAEVAAGSGHTCVLTDAGGVKCWGRNEAGQLGDIGPGEMFYGDRLTAVDVAGLNAGVTAVTAGGGHACALTSGGGVKCWGANDAGQLGIGTTNFTRTSPSDVVGLTSGVIAISAGGRHTCAVMATRAVKCWGANADGQLGDGTTTNSSLPVDVSGLGGSVATLSAGSNHTCVVTTGGAAQCWGRNDTAQLGDGTMVDKLLPTTVTGLGAGVGSITAGDDFSCAVTTAGAARCWGRNTFGQIGDGTNTLRTTATAVSGLGSGVSMLDAGVYHACAVSSDGAVRCWGWNASGQVGNGGASNFTLPTATPTLVSSVGGNVAAVAAGSEHSCARMSDSSVKCWGSSASGKLGDGTKGLQAVAADVHGLGGNVAAVAAGYEFGCAVTVAGRMVCWGNNGQGQLGNGTVVSSTVPGDVLSLSSGMIAVSAGMGTGGHACGLTSGRGLKCWGSGSGGRLGDGTFVDRLAPVDVTGLASGVATFSAGGFHTCAVTSVGGVKCWGGNFYGGLGDGSLLTRPTPVDVVGLGSGVIAVAAGYYHTCGLTTGGGVKCWGRNESGQLGNGNTTDSSTPVDVVGLSSGVLAISAGQSFTCALVSGGGVQCWGENSSRQLGDGSTTNRLTPIPVAGSVADIVAIDAGNFHACARTTAGGMKCWGANHEGQLGDGSTEVRATAVDVSGLTQGVAAFDAGGNQTCALTTSGGAKCWGLDASGQLGNGGRNYLLPGNVFVDSLASRSASGGDDSSYAAASDASGRYLIFESRARTLGASADTNEQPDIFRRDLATGMVERISVDDGNAQIAAASIEPSVTADGQRVVFVTQDAAVNKVHGESKADRAKRLKASTHGVYMRSLINGATFRMSVGIPALGGGVGTTPTISPAGNALVYTGQVADPAVGQPGPQIIHVPIAYQPNGAPVLGTPRCVSCKTVNAAGDESGTNAAGASRNAVISADGVWVAFETQAKNLLSASPSPCPNSTSEIMLRNLVTGVSQRISAPASPASCGPAGSGSRKPSMDWAGGKIVYESDQPLTATDRNAHPDVFLFDAVQGRMARISETLDTAYDGNGDSVQPAISGDGKVISFRSAAKNFEPREPDNNETDDIYVRRLDQSLLRRVSRNKRGDQADLASRRPTLNYNGTRVAFDTDATNLSLSDSDNQLLDTNGVSDVYQTNNPTTAEVVFRSGF